MASQCVVQCAVQTETQLPRSNESSIAACVLPAQQSDGLGRDIPCIAPSITAKICGSLLGKPARPVVKLTRDLLHTYRSINTCHFKTNHAASAAHTTALGDSKDAKEKMASGSMISCPQLKESESKQQKKSILVDCGSKSKRDTSHHFMVVSGKRFGPENRYEVIRTLGSGTFSVVVECIDYESDPPVSKLRSLLSGF